MNQKDILQEINRKLDTFKEKVESLLDANKKLREALDETMAANAITESHLESAREYLGSAKGRIESYEYKIARLIEWVEERPIRDIKEWEEFKNNLLKGTNFF